MLITSQKIYQSLKTARKLHDKMHSNIHIDQLYLDSMRNVIAEIEKALFNSYKTLNASEYQIMLKTIKSD